jgi:transcriptional regulator GlxA family with amidase domain
LQVALLIFDEVEVLDAMGLLEVFSVASRLRSADSDPFTVSLVARSNKVVTARGGLKLIPDAVFDDIVKCDLLIVPGGVTERAEADAETIHWLALHGSFRPCEGWDPDRPDSDDPLGRRGYAGRGLLRLTVFENTRWLNSGNIYTSNGVSAGIDLSLHLIEVMTSADQAHRTADGLPLGSKLRSRMADHRRALFQVHRRAWSRPDSDRQSRPQAEPRRRFLPSRETGRVP